MSQNTNVALLGQFLTQMCQFFNNVASSDVASGATNVVRFAGASASSCPNVICPPAASGSDINPAMVWDGNNLSDMPIGSQIWCCRGLYEGGYGL